MSTRYLIVSDDLSGAADCAAGFAGAGLNTAVVLDVQASSSATSAQVLTVDTDSRRDSSEQSAAKLQRVLAAHAPGRTVLKKIDSTLRGGWASEVATLQKALHGIALIAPSFPAMNRVMRDGLVYVNGQRLAETDTWKLEHAHRDDRPAQMLGDAGLSVELAPESVLDAGAEAATQFINQANARGVQAIVFDVSSDEHLRTLARASERVDNAFSVCSAGLSHALAQLASSGAPSSKASLPAMHAQSRSVITIVGSMSAIAREQMQHLAQQSDVRLHEIAPSLLRANAQRDASDLLQTVLEEMAQGHDIVISIGNDAHLNPAEGPQLAARLAQLLHQPLSQAAGLVVTGGETARAVLQELDIHTLHVHSESEPGVVLSVSESRHPQWIATKAGAFGNAQSLHRASEAIHSWMAGTSPVTTRRHSTEEQEMSANLPTIGITMGDAAGVGPEIIVKSFANPSLYKLARAVVIGDAKRLEAANQLLKLDVRVRPIQSMEQAQFEHGVIDCIDLQLIPQDMPFGKLSAVAGDAAFRFIERAVELAKSNQIDAICTAPLNKEALHAGGHKFPGHTEMLAHLTGVDEVSMMLVAPNLRVIHVTTHIGLLDAIRKIEPGLVERTIQRGYDTLRKAHIENPRIAVCGINPHAGENGLFGYGEEEEKIIPAVEALRAKGMDIEGPLPADTLFFRAGRGDFDLVVAMYHDQGHGPVKVLGLEAGVNITVGLDVIRTSVDHGTAFDIAGKGIADERSLLEALRQGAELATRR